MPNFCLLADFLDEKAELGNSRKIQEYIISYNVINYIGGSSGSSNIQQKSPEGIQQKAPKQLRLLGAWEDSLKSNSTHQQTRQRSHHLNRGLLFACEDTGRRTMARFERPYSCIRHT